MTRIYEALGTDGRDPATFTVDPTEDGGVLVGVDYGENDPGSQVILTAAQAEELRAALTVYRADLPLDTTSKASLDWHDANGRYLSAYEVGLLTSTGGSTRLCSWANHQVRGPLGSAKRGGTARTICQGCAATAGVPVMW